MEQTTLRPKPLPGRNTGRGRGDSPGQSPCRDPEDHPGKNGRPYTARRRGRRLAAVLSGVLLAVLLLLSGVGIGTVGATVIGMSALAEMRQGAPAPQPPAGDGNPVRQPEAPKPGAPKPGVVEPAAPQPALPKSAPAKPTGAATLGVEAVDAPGDPGAGALIVGVHTPGPGHTAGLVRGDTLLTFGGTRVTSAAALASAVAAARPGRQLTLTVRHKDGSRESLSARPGIVT
ncbi:PDZ domain-containing protein [Streptomyces sp. NPDC017988]|uniref:PDZ domain-containing protein n=1 Tax=Streptomyces sp. NPDC017988 TaxID=3365025 RepID=UPI0037891ED6